MSCASSAANDFTTRVPVTFSSTIVAMSAVRAIMSHAIGNSFFRMLSPVMNTNGSVTRVISVSTMSICNINASAARNVRSEIPIIGPNASIIWMARMSEFAREMS